MAKITVNVPNKDVYVIEALKGKDEIEARATYINPNDKVVEVDKPESNVVFLVVIPA